MRFIVGNTDGKTLGLNANELCVLEAISKCSRKEDAKGWYGSMQALADSLPFVIDRMTVDRAVKKLHSLGLLEKRENNTWVIAQNVQCNAQNVQPIAQNVQKSLPLNNPPIYNNMNENQLSSPAQDARTEEKKTEENLDFMDFWFLFSAPKEMLNRENACRRLWESQTFSRAKKQAIMKELTEHQMNGTLTEERNPFFYLNNHDEPQPVFLRGDETGDIVQVRYNGAYKLCTRETMDLFGLEWNRDW